MGVATTLLGPTQSTGGVSQSDLSAQLSTLQAQITVAQNAATAAQTTASGAQTTANTAQTNAASAQSTASSAQTTAGTAQTKSNDVQSQVTALAAAMPAPSTVVPQALANTGAVGTGLTFARADHIHQSSAQSTRVPVSGAGGQITWTYPIPYGATPFVVATCECASGASSPFVVNLVGQPSATSVTLAVFKTAAVTLPGLATSLLGYVVNQFGVAPAGTYVNILVRAATP